MKKKEEVATTLIDAVHQIVADKGLEKENVIEIIKEGLLAAYKKKFKHVENIEVFFDKDSNDMYLIVKRIVVDKVIDVGMQIQLDEAKKINPDVKIDDVVDVIERPQSYDRRSTQVAMHVIDQKIKSLEKQKIIEEYEDKVGELINGYILRKRGDTVYVDLGKVEAILPVKHQIPGEKYRVEDRVKVLIYSIDEDNRNKNIKVIVSRADKQFMQKLFEMEVPEIYEGIVEIKNIGRVPGIRSKVVVTTDRKEVDPVGACVGMRGVRIQAIVREIGNERIDIIEYSANPQEFISNALSPVTPSFIKIDSDKKEALAVVSSKEDLSIAIGQRGSNVKIASYITGYKIDVKSEFDIEDEMSSPEAKKKLDDLFSTSKKSDDDVEKEEEIEEEGTPLYELPIMTKRIKKLLNGGGIHYIEDLISLEEEELVNIEGIGSSTAKRIMEIISESIEFEEEEDVEEDTEIKTENTIEVEKDNIKAEEVEVINNSSE